MTTQWSGIWNPSAAAQSMPQDSHSQDASEWHQCSRNKEDRQEKCHSIHGKMDILDIKECDKIETQCMESSISDKYYCSYVYIRQNRPKRKKTTGNKEGYHIKI